MTDVKQYQQSSALALERCKSFTFDVNQQAESLSQWEQHYNQHGSGIFNGYLDELKLEGIHFFEEFTSRILQQECNVKEESLWLGFSQQAQRPRINNDKILTDQIMTRPSNIPFELITPSDFHIYGLVINKATLYNGMFGSDLELWQKINTKITASKPNHYVSYELTKLIDLLLNGHELFQNNKPSRLKTLAPLITSKVIDLLGKLEYDNTELNITHYTKQRVIANVNNYIKKNNQYPLTVTELCKITNDPVNNSV
ncbi:hypothetical protein E2R68_12175 [Psychromonas sp. RZ22]|uniref:hypothetical protein n=1 Tax=Psychromonas algarum TaxID=2555643 RepID=UPI0010675FF1|nr:hypothetical protein [Psychromonas sp. RZ22]TEW53569.1 hypothetical protein E2R68_12175 [Psychromonas sp. RZ22]